MNPIISKTLGGLSFKYYARNFFFGALLAYILYFLHTYNGDPLPLGMAVFFMLNTLLYPYARFAWDSVADFILGANVFFLNMFLMLFIKMVVIMFCWGLSIFIAPVGMAYLFYYHSRNEARP